MDGAAASRDIVVIGASTGGIDALPVLLGDLPAYLPAVAGAQGEEVDRLLDTLLRAQQERAGLARRMAEHERRSGRTSLADQLARRARDDDDGVRLLEALIHNGEGGGEVLTSPQQQGAPRDEQEA
ncbi:hypothetical protein [Enhydrobacter sp.]|jgi:hypothetical protein|uniref:hypothetical protein n=1 Tax=Enhydrobacter sp. TaxID=1894999 RepID=UPI002637C554|nr:hypothetical protein [Enhydrobacter sp.]WIM09075.1 MAG: hypothetical protein OJF58_000026 [Enhydrobacter sp.]